MAMALGILGAVASAVGSFAGGKPATPTVYIPPVAAPPEMEKAPPAPEIADAQEILKDNEDYQNSQRQRAVIAGKQEQVSTMTTRFTPIYANAPQTKTPTLLGE